MRSHRAELWFQTRNRREYIKITPEVAEEVARSGVDEGL
jgi:thiamine phosphate synthase YjbQ (UPF0047 family)